MSRNTIDTKTRILQAANRLFYSEGIRAVSLDAVAQKADITKKSIYYHFRSKDDLVTEYLKSRDQPNIDTFKKWFADAEGDLADKIFAIFKGVAESAQHPKWCGCGFLRTAGELANQPGHPAVKAGATHKKRFENWLAEKCNEAGISKDLQTARRIAILMDGAFAASLIHGDPSYIIEAGEIAQLVVNDQFQKSHN